MPLSNRAPVNAAGQIMVTGTTPTPAWPVLGGMTYDPVTGELAVTSAVPNATDPWVGGLRFTNLGALYIVTTIPSPVFYVGGLPVSTLGQLFMSANPPVGSVGGWPIAGDGGVAGIGSGIGPVPIFWAPLITSLVPTVAGNPTFTFTRATTAYVADQDGILRLAIANEARFHGARRVRNALPFGSENNTLANVVSGITTTPTTIDFAGAGSYCFQQKFFGTGVVTGNKYVFSVMLSSASKATIGIGMYDLGGLSAFSSCALTATPKRFTVSGVFTATGSQLGCGLDNRPGTGGDGIAGIITATNWQLEDVSGQSNQAPGDYVSVGVLASPYHGNGVDGVKCFATTNGNSVAANVVTEATGTLIPAATLLGYVAENAATNIAKESQTFDNAAWGAVASNAVITADNIAAPDGTLTADRYADNATNSFHRVSQSVTTVVATTYTQSVYAKAGTLTWMQLTLYDASHNFANFNLVTGVIGNKSAGVTAAIVALPNGWYRCSVTFTVGSTVSIAQVFSLLSDLNVGAPVYVGTGQTMYLWGAQVETGSDPTSYIPTTTAAVVRAADALTYQAATNLDTALATTYAEFLPTSLPAAYQVIVAWVNGNTNPLMVNVGPKGVLTNSGGGLFTTTNLVPLGTLSKAASAWGGATTSVCLNGGAVATGAYTARPTPSALAFGQDSALALKGTLRNVKFYNVRIADADLITMTA